MHTLTHSRTDQSHPTPAGWSPGMWSLGLVPDPNAFLTSARGSLPQTCVPSVSATSPSQTGQCRALVPMHMAVLTLLPPGHIGERQLELGPRSSSVCHLLIRSQASRGPRTLPSSHGRAARPATPLPQVLAPPCPPQCERQPAPWQQHLRVLLPGFLFCC